MSTIPGKYPLTVFFDGDCPICAREISILNLLNRRQRVHFVNFADSRYDEAATGLARSDLGRVIHARRADGEMILGVEVFRAIWSAVGLAWLARLSRLPFIDWLLIRGYDWFARNRLRLTGRLSLSDNTQERAVTSQPCERCRVKTGLPDDR